MPGKNSHLIYRQMPQKNYFVKKIEDIRPNDLKKVTFIEQARAKIFFLNLGKDQMNIVKRSPIFLYLKDLIFE